MSMLTNPYTGRPIKKGGRVHTRLQRGGVLTPEEEAFIKEHNIKGRFKRAISQLPLAERAEYETQLEDPNLARNVRDAESDARIHRTRAAAAGWNYPQQEGGFSIGRNKYQNLDLDSLTLDNLKSITKIIQEEKRQSPYVHLLNILPANSKYAKRLGKVVSDGDKILSEMENEATTLMH